MKHLTWNDIFELIDAPAPSPRRPELDQHLAECPSCRRLLESQRSYERLARKVPPAEPSAELAGRIIGLVQSSRKERTVLRLLTGLGAGIPLILVATMIAYAIALGPLPEPGGADQLLGGASGQMDGALEWVQSALGSVLGKTGIELGTIVPTNVVTLAMLTVSSIFLLFVADRFFLRRILRSRL
jgi:hypothetical protein